jgi:hypothetical protein
VWLTKSFSWTSSRKGWQWEGDNRRRVEGHQRDTETCSKVCWFDTWEIRAFGRHLCARGQKDLSFLSRVALGSLSQPVKASVRGTGPYLPSLPPGL